MANNFVRFPIAGGDDGVWAPNAEQQLRMGGLGQYTARLYLDGGALKLDKGLIGIDDGTNEGCSIIDTVTTISDAAIGNSIWSQIEMSVSGTSVTLAITAMAGETDPAALPAAFTGGYDGDKQGFYINATKRCLGMVWKNAGGTLEGVINAGSYREEYEGYSQSDDSNDVPYFFEKILQDRSDKYINSEIAAITSNRSIEQDASGSYSIKNLLTCIVEIGNWNMHTSGVGTNTHGVSVPAAPIGLSSLTKIREMSVIIVKDDSSQIYPHWLTSNEVYFNTVQKPAANVGFDLVSIDNIFDNANFSVAPGGNRGWVIIKYEA